MQPVKSNIFWGQIQYTFGMMCSGYYPSKHGLGILRIFRVWPWKAHWNDCILHRISVEDCQILVKIHMSVLSAWVTVVCTHDPSIRHSTRALTFFGSERMPMILWTNSSDYLWLSDEPHEQSATKRWLALKKIWLSHHFKCYFHQLAFVISRKRSNRRWVWSNFSVSIYIWNNIFPPEIAWTKLFLPEYNIYLKLYSAKLKRSKYFVMFQFFQVWFPMFLKSCTSQILSFAFL